MSAAAGGVSRSEHKDLQDQVAKIEAANIVIRADIVRIDGKVGIVVHSLEGNGVEGIEQRVKEIEVFIAGAPARAKASLLRKLGIAVGIVALIGAVTGFVTWLSNLIKGAQ